MFRRYDTTGNGTFLIDSHRKTSNTDSNPFLRLHTRGQEGTGTAGANSIYVDFLSNGVKMRSTDSELNGDLIYWAIAERPFVSSTGIPNTAQ